MALLRRALGFRAQAAFADFLGIAHARWSNFERGSPVSKAVAVRLKVRFPGLTTDWILTGDRSGLSDAIAELLDNASAANSAPLTSEE